MFYRRKRNREKDAVYGGDAYDRNTFGAVDNSTSTLTSTLNSTTTTPKVPPPPTPGFSLPYPSYHNPPNLSYSNSTTLPNSQSPSIGSMVELEKHSPRVMLQSSFSTIGYENDTRYHTTAAATAVAAGVGVGVTRPLHIHPRGTHASNSSRTGSREALVAPLQHQHQHQQQRVATPNNAGIGLGVRGGGPGRHRTPVQAPDGHISFRPSPRLNQNPVTETRNASTAANQLPSSLIPGLPPAPNRPAPTPVPSPRSAVSPYTSPVSATSLPYLSGPASATTPNSTHPNPNSNSTAFPAPAQASPYPPPRSHMRQQPSWVKPPLGSNTTPKSGTTLHLASPPHYESVYGDGWLGGGGVYGGIQDERASRFGGRRG